VRERIKATFKGGYPFIIYYFFLEIRTLIININKGISKIEKDRENIV